MAQTKRYGTNPCHILPMDRLHMMLISYYDNLKNNHEIQKNYYSLLILVMNLGESLHDYKYGPLQVWSIRNMVHY